jgi:hypothetical protein
MQQMNIIKIPLAVIEAKMKRKQNQNNHPKLNDTWQDRTQSVPQASDTQFDPENQI